MTDFHDIPLCTGASPDRDLPPIPVLPLSAAQARAVADIRCSLMTASSMPRDPHRIRMRLARQCRQADFAALALDDASPSLPLARTLARLWGNLHFGMRTDGRELEIFAWDTETNVRTVHRFPVADDSPDIRNAHLRDVLLALLPDAFVAEALMLCRRTLDASGADARAAVLPEHDAAPMPTPAPDTSCPGSAPAHDAPDTAETALSVPSEHAAEPCRRSPDRSDRTSSSRSRSEAASSSVAGNVAETPSRRRRRAARKLAAVTSADDCSAVAPSPVATDDTTPDPGSETSAAAEAPSEPIRNDTASAAPAEAMPPSGADDADHPSRDDAESCRDTASAEAEQSPCLQNSHAGLSSLRYQPELILCPERSREVDTLECHACARHDHCPAYA